MPFTNSHHLDREPLQLLARDGLGAAAIPPPQPYPGLAMVQRAVCLTDG